MKTFVFFGTLCAVLLVGVRCDFTHEQEECIKELKLDRAAMKSIAADEDIMPEDNADFNKLTECDWKKEGSMKANGEIDWDKVDDLLLEEFRKEVGDNPKLSEFITGLVIVGAVEECKEEHITGSTPGQTAVKLQNCVVHKILKLAESKD